MAQSSVNGSHMRWGPDQSGFGSPLHHSTFESVYPLAKTNYNLCMN